MYNNITRTRMNTFNEDVKAGWQGLKSTPKKPSMTTLVSWNVSKALEHNPHLDLKEAIKSAQVRLEDSAQVLEETSRLPEERYLACALLAWQRLGHSDADSLYSFVAITQNERNRNEQKAKDERDSRPSSTESFNNSRDRNLFQNAQEYPANANVWRMGVSSSIGAGSLGPVLKIPQVPKTVMRLEDSPICIKKNQYMSSSGAEGKMDDMCCFDSECADALDSMDQTTADLRKRACQLARREAERGALLERAEAAWRDLESGYQRRLMLASEKEEDILRQNEKVASERNVQKSACNEIVKQLESDSKSAEEEKAELSSLEKEVCSSAVERAQLLERAASSDARLADVLCQVAQFDRNVTFREQQMLQKQQALESEIEGAMALKLEADRAMRAELLGLLGQVQEVAQDLLAEDKDSCRFMCDLEELREERDGLSDDLEGCQTKCDAPLQKTLDEIKIKRQELAHVRDLEMECRCKRPVDKSVTAKRTASLAALCECTPEDALTSACSCTSMRGRVLSDLLADLFRGLQSQLCHDTVMPCQMLKCLEDKHKWDGASDVKTSLRNYFSKLLLGELDIAIATSIENYHVKWVGESCADKTRTAKAPCGVSHSETWQQQALELKAKSMAERLAEQMFQQKAQQLADQAKEILASSGRPPCECHPATCVPNTKTVFQCLVKTPRRRSPVSPTRRSPSPPLYLRQTLQDVNNLRTEIKNLKKDTVNREDNNLIEKKYGKMVKPRVPIRKASNSPDKIMKKTITKRSLVDTSVIQKPLHKRKQIMNNNIFPKTTKSNSTKIKTSRQPISVNMCLIDPQKEICTPSKLSKRISDASKSKDYQSGLLNCSLPDSSIKQEKTSLKSSDCGSSKRFCTEEGSCFHKKPSNTSIDKLLQTLSKWKEDLVEFQDKRSSKLDQPNLTINNQHQRPTQCVSNSSKSIQVQNQSNMAVKKGISKLVVFKLSSQEIDPTINCENIETKSPVPVKDSSPENPTLPISIESEYMGDINLEKSSISCKNDTNIVETRTSCNKCSTQIPYRCIGSTNCPCPDCYSAPVCHEQGLDAQSFILDLIPSCQQCKRKSNDLPSNTIFNQKFAGYAAKSILGNAIEPSGNTEIGCKNHIKCLGVTLTNVFSKKSLKTKSKPKNKTKMTERKKEFYEITNQNKIPYTQSYVHNENRNSLANIYHIKQNKSADSVGSHKTEILCDSELCICCQNFDTENSKDLEVNTFQLLEEHVKGKLEEFKKTFCDASCIPTAEEEKLFTAILQRIKLLIAESTRPATCKCGNKSNQVNGSWNRAYNLLQEYLKSKMERATCQCCSDSKHKGINDLPKVLNKISLLIEKDLQRIKSICICKNAEPLAESKDLSSNSEVKDNLLNIDLRKIKHIAFDQNTVRDPVKETNNKLVEDLKKTIFLTHNISAQVSHYQSTEAKSCTAMTIDHKYTEVQTVDEIKLSIDEYCSVKGDLVNQNNEAPEVSSNFWDAELLNTSKKISGIHVKIEQSLNKEATQNVDKTNKECCKAPLPYIGYTLNCSCNHDLGCVCTKSTVRAADERPNINKIWKTLTKEEALSKKYSYMLHNTPDELSKDMNQCKVTEGCYKKHVPKAKSVHVTKINVRETVVNKSKINRATAHEGTNTVKHIKNYKSDLNVDNSPKTPTHTEFASKPDRCETDNLDVIKQNKLDDLYFPGDHFQLSDNSDIAIEKSDSCSTNCDCKMVPICHVKMLVANIEGKLANAQCTCDSLSPKVCPVHS